MNYTFPKMPRTAPTGAILFIENGIEYYGIPGMLINRLDSFTAEKQAEIRNYFNKLNA